MGRIVKKGFKAIGAVAAILAVIPSPIQPIAAIVAVGAGVVNIGLDALAKNPSPVSEAATDRLTASINLNARRKIWLGTTIGAADIRDHESTDDDEFVHGFYLNAAHLATSHDQIWIGSELAWTSAGGVQGVFVDYLEVTAISEGSAANAINISARMGDTRRYTGLAYVYLRFKITGINNDVESPFAQGIPPNIKFRGEGAPVYDPRLDSTVPSGSGTQSVTDQSTWAFDPGGAQSGDNPALQLLWCLLGWRIQNPVTGAWKLSVGFGIPVERIDLESFITAANICDETVSLEAGGTEPRYRSAGVFSEADDPNIVVGALEASMNGRLRDYNGKFSLKLFTNELGSPVAAFNDGEGDLMGPLEYEVGPDLGGDFNIIEGRYVDASDETLYQPVPFPAVSLDSVDEIDRNSLPFELLTVQSMSQAQRLAKQRLQRNQLRRRFSGTFNARGWLCAKDDIITLTSSAYAFVDKLFRVEDHVVHPDRTVEMILIEEDAALYQWDADESPAVVPVSPSIFDSNNAPLIKGVLAGQASAASAEAAADAAQADATTGLGKLADFENDGKLTKPERGELYLWLNRQIKSRDNMRASATARGGLTTELDDEEAKWSGPSGLKTYFDTLSPPLSSTSLTPTPISKATRNTRGQNWQDALSKLQKAIDARASETADFSVLDGISGGMVANPFFKARRADGLPANWYVSENNPGPLSADLLKPIDGGGGRIGDGTADSAFAIAGTPIRGEPGQQIRFFVALEGEADSTSGLYLRMEESDDEAAATAKYIGHATGETGGIVRSSYSTLIDDTVGAVSDDPISDELTYYSGIYTVPAGVKYFSPSIYNWDGNGTNYIDCFAYQCVNIATRNIGDLADLDAILWGGPELLNIPGSFGSNYLPPEYRYFEQDHAPGLTLVGMTGPDPTGITNPLTGNKAAEFIGDGSASTAKLELYRSEAPYNFTLPGGSKYIVRAYAAEVGNATQRWRAVVRLSTGAEYVGSWRTGTYDDRIEVDLTSSGNKQCRIRYELNRTDAANIAATDSLFPYFTGVYEKIGETDQVPQPDINSIIDRMKLPTVEKDADKLFVVEPSAFAHNIKYDHQGAAEANELNYVKTFDLEDKSGTDFSASATFATALIYGDCSRSINSSGQLTVTALGADSLLRIEASLNGNTYSGFLTLNKVIAAAPVGGGSDYDSASTNGSGAYSSTAYGTAILGPITCTAQSDEELRPILTLSQYTSNQITAVSLTGKIQAKPPGGSWADISGSEKEGSNTTSFNEPPWQALTTGSLVISGHNLDNSDGVGVDEDWQIRALVKNTDNATAINWIGSLSVESGTP